MVDRLREALDDETNEGLLHETWESIAEAREEMLMALALTPERLATARTRLEKYRLITDAKDLRKGCSIYWFDVSDVEECKFGFVNAVLPPRNVSTDDLEAVTDTLVQCSNVMHRRYTLRFEKCVVFQQLRPQEIMIINLVSRSRQQR